MNNRPQRICVLVVQVGTKAIHTGRVDLYPRGNLKRTRPQMRTRKAQNPCGLPRVTRYRR